jgi:hypothetical protein
MAQFLAISSDVEDIEYKIEDVEYKIEKTGSLKIGPCTSS